MDKDVVLNKLESLRRCLQRVEDKTPISPDLLVKDYDLQDLIVLNLERSVPMCVEKRSNVRFDPELSNHLTFFLITAAFLMSYALAGFESCWI
ncbi:MAG: hypothetical protein JXN62_07270 [Bacteroidales bacterium]|nr:hypothetical protein [Bacteroidales bacterium]